MTQRDMAGILGIDVDGKITGDATLTSHYNFALDLIKDLENKEFKIISRNKYYRSKVNASKDEIKKYLARIQKKYTLNSRSIKEFRDTIP